MELNNVVPWGRSYEEYKEMFSLTDQDLTKSILGCGDGPASFNSVLTRRGGNVISIDPAYKFDSLSLKNRISEVYDEVMPQMHGTKGKYIWDTIPSVDALGEIRMEAMDAFIADYDSGKESGRYLEASLPELTFNDHEFDLALCSHYLFLYSSQVSLDAHINSIKELCRVAKEVRIYPLLSLNGEISPHLGKVIQSLSHSGLSSSLADVKYQFQKGAIQMLVVKSM